MIETAKHLSLIWALKIENIKKYLLPRNKIEWADDSCVDVHFGPELVVGPKHDETSPRDREGKEHLLSSFPPDLDLRQLVPFWDKEFPEKEKMY